MSLPIPPASICEPALGPAQIIAADGSTTWLTRGRTFVVAVSKVQSGCVLSRSDNLDEYMLFLSEGMKTEVQAGTEQLDLDGSGDVLVIVPPGASEIRSRSEGWVTRIFSHRAKDLAAAAGNAEQQPVAASDAPPAAPPGGFRLRHYPLAQFIKPDSPARPFRSTNLMVNAFVPRNFRRDVRKMTPHAHADFDQASLALQGTFTHHIRYPWTADMTTWRDDEHHAVGSPSVIVIPAQSVHTTQDTGVGFAQLVDIFSPPRPDFVEKPGWVCNEADYPLAEGVPT